ncbi:hypothetical protein Tco_0220352, partial [Tanacetum coccineum]
KKKSSISVDDNIIPEPDVALELGKSMSLTEAEEEEAARRVHATHECLVTESDEPSDEPTNRPTGRRRPSVMSAEEQLAADMKKAIKAKVPDELTGKFTTSSEGAGIVLEVPAEGKCSEITWLSTDEEEKANEDDDEEDDDRSIDIAETDDETTESENDDQEMI